MLTIPRRYLINGTVFLTGYFGSQIFGAFVWHFVVVNVQHWWRGHGVAGLIGGLVGMAVFVGVNEYRRHERITRSVPRRQPSGQPSGPWA